MEGQPWLSAGVMYRKGVVEGQPWLSRGYVKGLCKVRRGYVGVVEGQPWLSRGYVGQGLWKGRGCGRSAVVVQGLCRKGFVEGQPWLSRGYVGKGLWKVSRGCPGVM